MITLDTLSAAICYSLAERRRLEKAQRARVVQEQAVKAAQDAEREAEWRSERDRRQQALEAERQMARLEQTRVSAINEPVLTEHQREAQRAHLRFIDERRQQIQAAIDPDGLVREAKRLREEQREDERLAFLSAQIAGQAR